MNNILLETINLKKTYEHKIEQFNYLIMLILKLKKVI